MRTLSVSIGSKPTYYVETDDPESVVKDVLISLQHDHPFSEYDWGGGNGNYYIQASTGIVVARLYWVDPS